MSQNTLRICTKMSIYTLVLFKDLEKIHVDYNFNTH